MAASLCVVGLTGLSLGCGTDEEALKREKDAAARKQGAEREKREQAAKEREEARVAARTCDNEMDGLVTALNELNSRLNVGLNYDEYTDKVGDVRVAYDGIDYDNLEEAPECLSEVGVPAENALNEYVKASNTSSKCFDDIDCSNYSIQPSLQKRWSKATRHIERAREGLREMEEAAGGSESASTPSAPTEPGSGTDASADEFQKCLNEADSFPEQQECARDELGE